MALAVRLYFANTLYLNPDECMHLNAAAAGQWAAVHHPPLLLWWLWFASLVSDQAWWLRSLPTLCGALTPLAAALWWRRFLPAPTAWGLAALVALSPNLVLLSVQLRGYPMAMLAVMTALYALDRAFAERSRRLLGWHFAALLIAAVAEFSVAWVALAAGLYGLVMLTRRPELRPLASLWTAGQLGLGLAYGLLYVLIVRVVTAVHPMHALLDSYLRGTVPAPGQNWLVFCALGVTRQFAYVASSWLPGIIGAALAAAGLWIWWRKGEERLILSGGVFLAVLGALALVHPFGRSRHTVLIGLVGLAAVGAGIEALGRWKGFAMVAAIGAVFAPAMDPHNIPLAQWERGRWERAMARMEAAIPEGTSLLVDEETMEMLQVRWQPRGERRLHADWPRTLRFRRWTVVVARAFDWRSIPTPTLLASVPAGPVWIVDMGFTAESVKARAEALALSQEVDEPGVLFAARLR